MKTGDKVTAITGLVVWTGTVATEPNHLVHLYVDTVDGESYDGPQPVPFSKQAVFEKKRKSRAKAPLTK